MRRAATKFCGKLTSKRRIILGVGIIGIGKKLADNIVMNEEICELMDTSNEWIIERTGITERRIATTQKSLDLAVDATKEALEGIDYDSIDLVIVATCTPDMLVPSMGSLVKMELGLKNAIVFDLNSACSGFVFTLWTAESLMNASQEKMGRKINRALVIGSERITRIADWTDRGSCILFGDGAGTVLLERREGQTGIITTFLKNYDDVNQALWCGLDYEPNPFSKEEISPPRTLQMKGTQVFKFAVTAVNEVMEEVLKCADMDASEVDFYVPHQANMRIIKSAAARFKQPLEKFQISINQTGNVSAASIPMALYDAMQEGKVKSGDTIMFVGFGGGLSAGASLVKLW